MFKDRQTDRQTDRQSDIVDYRAAYFAAKKWVFFKASLIVIEISWILTLIMKTSLYRNTQLYMKATFIDLSDLVLSWLSFTSKILVIFAAPALGWP